MDVEVIKPPFKSRYFQHLWEQLYVPHVAKNYKVLFCPANISPVFKPSNVKVVTTIHDLSFLYFPESFSFLYRNFYKKLTPLVLKRSDVIITVSNFEKQKILSIYPEVSNKLVVIYSGINESFFAPSSSESREYLLYVGNLIYRKNFHGIIVAFSRVYKEINRKLVIVGITPKTMKMHKKTIQYLNLIPPEFIEFKGQINDIDVLKKIYDGAFMFLFPSFYESFGFPAIEAMARGCPVIASKNTALEEICYKGALYVDPYDIDDLCDKMIKIDRDKILREKLIKEGTKRALTFRWSEAALKYKKIFDEMTHD